MGKFKCYVVWVGRRPGVYYTWSECYAQVNGYPGARYKGFVSVEDATNALSNIHGPVQQHMLPSTQSSQLHLNRNHVFIYFENWVMMVILLVILICVFLILLGIIVIIIHV